MPALDPSPPAPAPGTPDAPSVGGAAPALDAASSACAVDPVAGGEAMTEQASLALAGAPGALAASPVSDEAQSERAARDAVAPDGAVLDDPGPVTTSAPPLVTAPIEASAPLRARLHALTARPGARRALLAALVLGPVTVTSAVVLVAARSHPPPAAASAVAPAPLTLPIAPAPAESASAEPGGGPAIATSALATPSADATPAPDAGAPPAGTWRVAHLGPDPDVQIATAQVGKRAFAAALAAAGAAKAEVQRILAAFGGVHRFDRCAAKDTFTLARSKTTGRLLAFEYATSPVEVWQARTNDAGGLEAKKLELHVEHVPVAVAVPVQDDVLHAVTAAGLDDDLVAMIDDALHGQVDLGRIRGGARLRLLAREDRVDGAFGRYAELEALEYLPPSGAPLRVYHFEPPRRGRNTAPPGFYDGKGRQPYPSGWRCPVPLARLSSRYNPRRVHPVLKIVLPHNGVDYAAPPGTPVYATAAGTVSSVGDGGPCGNMIQVLHPNGLTSAYCHLSRFGPVHPGQHVEGRQLLGYVGQTGRATGPHLHFAVKRGDIFLDPLALRLDGMRVLPPADRDAFAKRRDELDARLEAIALPAAPAPAPAPDGGASDEVFYDDPSP